MALESMRIVTGCRTPEQFISVFHRFCDAKTCFIPTTDTRPVGSTLAFSLRLVDGTSMLRGTCVVLAAWQDKDNAFKRPGVQLEIQKLTADSVALFEELLAQKTAVVPPPTEVTSAPADGIVEEVTRLTTDQHVPRDKAIDLILRAGNAPAITKTAVDETATVEMPPLQYKTETRVPGSAIVLPANPLTDVDEHALDAFLSCSMSDDGDAAPIDSDLAIPVEQVPAVKAREEMRTLLGVAPIAAAVRREAPPLARAEVVLDKPPLARAEVVLDKPPIALVREAPPLARAEAVLDKPPLALAREVTRPFALPMRRPAMSANERMWFGFALAGVLLLAAIVLASAIVSAG